MNVIFLRFDAPLMSFGSVVVDHFNKTDLYPYRAMLVGLIGNALGLTREEADAHESIQRRLHYAARRDRAGTVLVDYQTVDFDPDGAMGSELAWTSERALEERKGGDASEGTHIRYRHYVADAIVTVVFTLSGDQLPDLSAIAAALQSPARPLFLGRKCCVPSVPVFLGLGTASSLREALTALPRLGSRADRGPLPAIWPSSESEGATDARWPRVEDRDWRNAIHVGRRMYVEGQVNPASAGPKSETMS